MADVFDAHGFGFGWGICTEGGEDHHDTQEDNIPVDEMLKATADFMRILVSWMRIISENRRATLCSLCP